MDSKTIERRLNRIEKTKLNTTITLFTSIIMGIFSFIERTTFNRFFIADYLGLYSFFNNIIGVLSAAELGLSTSIAFALYAPLELQKHDQIAAIMQFYKKAYFVVGTIILLGGILILPCMKYLLNTVVPMEEVRIYFLFFLLKTVSNYYLGYKETLLAANQEQYKITLVYNVAWTILYIVEIAIAIFTQDFLLYSISIFAINLIRTIILNIMATIEFPKIKSYRKVKIEKSIFNHLIKNTKGLIITRISTVLVSTTDSILISAMVGTAFLGRYSNYQMILSGLMALSTLIPKSITASVGNAGVTETKRSISRGFNALNLASFFVYGPLSILLINIINPIVSAFFGANRTLELLSVALICINFYLNNQREILLTYKSSLGLYWEDRKRPLAEGLTNLIVSILLGYKMGFSGIILGTIITNVFINLMIEPKVIFHSGFCSSTFWYYISTINRFLLTVAISFLTYFINSFIPFVGVLEIVLKSIVSLLFTVVILFLIYKNNDEAKTILKTLKIAFMDKKNQKKMLDM